MQCHSLPPWRYALYAYQVLTAVCLRVLEPGSNYHLAADR